MSMASLIAIVCHCRYFCAHCGGHGSPLFVIAVAVVDGVDAVVVPILCVVPILLDRLFLLLFNLVLVTSCFIFVFVDFGVVFLFVFRV